MDATTRHPPPPSSVFSLLPNTFSRHSSFLNEQRSKNSAHTKTSRSFYIQENIRTIPSHTFFCFYFLTRGTRSVLNNNKSQGHEQTRPIRGINRENLFDRYRLATPQVDQLDQGGRDSIVRNTFLGLSRTPSYFS